MEQEGLVTNQLAVTGDKRKAKETKAKFRKITLWKIIRVTERHDSIRFRKSNKSQKIKIKTTVKGATDLEMTSHAPTQKPEDDWKIAKEVKEKHCQSRIYVSRETSFKKKWNKDIFRWRKVVFTTKWPS